MLVLVHKSNSVSVVSLCLVVFTVNYTGQDKYGDLLITKLKFDLLCNCSVSTDY